MRIAVEPYKPMYDALLKRLDEVEKGGVANDVMLKAIRETAPQAKTMIHVGTRRMYTIKASAFRKSDIKLKQASKRNLRAILSVGGKALPLRASYRTRANSKKKAAKAMIKTSSNLKELELKSGGRSFKAFLATMKSGHEGIFQRVPGEYMKKRPRTEHMKGREKIKEICSLAKSKAVKNAWNDNVSSEVYDELYYRIHRHMNAVIGGSI